VPREKRTTKTIAQRIDLNYFKRPSPWRTRRFALSVALPCIAVAWLAAYAIARNNHAYSSGKMSPAHAVLTQQCGSCHVAKAGVFRAAAGDQACLSCHDGPIHHADQVFTPRCSSCHVEHRGRILLAATADASCTQCHADLRTSGKATSYATDITEFTPEGHPEFAPLRAGFRDPGTIKLDHAIHLKANLIGPNNSRVQMDCDDCHRANAADQSWRFGGGPAAQAQLPAATGGITGAMTAPISTAETGPPSHSSARAYMQPIAYAKHCVACHPLLFDKRFADSVPHDTPEVIHAFLVKRYTDYIATHPAELRETKSTIALPAKPVPVSPRVYTPPEWVSTRVAEAELLLWGKTCKQCHTLSSAAAAPPMAAPRLPVVAKSNIPARWFPQARFDHEAHREWACTTCHARATTSQETADILVPGERTCELCHHSGANAAESRCFECHTYHDWRQEKQVKGAARVTWMRIAGKPAS
jgi:predicted CXXCH cytochrome family protein